MLLWLYRTIHAMRRSDNSCTLGRRLFVYIISKKLLLIAACLCLIVCATSPGLSEGEEQEKRIENDNMINYHISSLGCHIYLPSELLVAYIGMPDSQLDKLGAQYQSIEDFLISSGVDILAFPDDFSYEVHGVKFAAPFTTKLKNCDDYTLKNFLKLFIPSTERNLGAKINASEIVKTSDNTYVRYEFSMENKGEENVIAYYTYSIGYIYEFYFYCREKVDQYEDDLSRTIMNGVLWD